MTMTNGRDRDYPPGTYQWHGAYRIRITSGSGKRGRGKYVVGGHVVRLPDGEVEMFDGAEKPIKLKAGRGFTVIINEHQVFCSVEAT